MKHFLQKIILFLFLFTGSVTQAQVKFSASVTPPEIGINEFTQLKLIVENASDVQQIVPPAFKNFIVISGPNQESGITMINGVVKRYIAITFILKPKAIGSYSIPPATAIAEGKKITSNSVNIKINVSSTNATNSSPNNSLTPFGSLDPFAEPASRATYNDYILKKGENPKDKISRNLFMRAEVNKISCFVGEPIMATFKLYTRLKSESNLVKSPSFNGFSVVDMPQTNETNYTVEKFQGREFNVYTLRKVQLYPLLSGKLDIGIAQVDNDVHFIKSEYVNSRGNAFDDMFKNFSDASIPPEGMEDLQVSLQNPPVSVLVKPLPVDGKPDNFKGAVGNYEIKSVVEKDNFSTDDAGRMAIVISGTGNLQLINAPDIKWPDSIEGFDPKTVDEINKLSIPISGRKIFEYPFTIPSPGNYTLPSVAFSFFDTHTNKYKTIATSPINIKITKGTGKPTIIPKTESGVKKDNFLTRFFSNRLRVVSVVAALIILCLIFWLKWDTRKDKLLQNDLQNEQPDNSSEKNIDEFVQSNINPLEKSEALLNNGASEEFFPALNEGMKNYLSEKLSIMPEQLNKKVLLEKLDKLGVANETVIQVFTLIDEIEFEIYTPNSHTHKMKELYEKASSLIQLLNTYSI